MRTTFLVAGVLMAVLLGSFVAGAAVFEADIRWDGEILPVEVFTGTDGIGIRVLYQNQPALRVLAENQSDMVLIIDDLNQTYAVVENQEAMAWSFLFSLSRVLGIEEQWLREDPIQFFSSGEQAHYPPFGECIRLRINESVSGIFWNRDISPSLGSLVEPYLAILRSTGINLPFWRAMASMPGFPVVVYQEDLVAFRLFNVREIEEGWKVNFVFEGYDEESWVDFLTPWK